MKILFLSRYQFPYVRSGGTGIVVYELMKELSNLGNKIEHWTWDTKSVDQEIKINNMVGFPPLINVESTDKKFHNFFDIYLHNLAMIKKFQHTEPFDVVHVHTWELYLAGLFAKYIWNVPMVFTTHDIMQGDLPSEVLEPDIYQHNVLGERNIAVEADTIVSVSEENREMFCKYYPEAACRTHVIQNGVDINVFYKRETKEVFRKHQIEISEPYILFLGRAAKQKGIESIIRALELIEEDLPFVFALSLTRWDGLKHTPADKYIGMIKDLMKKKKNIHLLFNEWERERVAELYSQAAFTLIPSIYEPGAITLFETQACSAPVITNNTGIMKEIVKDGVNGILLELDDDSENYARKFAGAILKLYHDKTLLNTMRQNARRNIVENHTWTHRALSYIQLYKSLIAKNAAAANQNLA